MTDDINGLDALEGKFSKHLKLNANGFLVMRARDKETREAWATLSEAEKSLEKLQALIRVTHELDARAAAIQGK